MQAGQQRDKENTSDPDRLNDAIIITDACDDDCAFCSQPRGWVPVLASETVIEALELRAQAGHKQVTFVGREPTLHPKLPEFVAAARQLGFQTILVNSNGKRLADRERADRLVDAGVTEFCISLHANDAAHSDQITVKRGFEQRLEGIRNVSQRVPVVLNFVIQEANFRLIPEFVEFVRTTFRGIRRPVRFLSSRRWLRHLPISCSGTPRVHFSYIELMPDFPMDAAMLPRYSDVAPYLERGLRADPTATVHPQHTQPPCTISPELRPRVLPRRHQPQHGWVFLPGCDRCQLKNRCQGIPEAYLRRYGATEFSPVV